jgi:hypothetical protein
MFGQSALLLAVEGNQIAAIQWLLQEGASKITERDGAGTTALIWAAFYGFTPIVSWLIREGGGSLNETDNHGNTPMTLAAREGKLATLQFIIEHGGGDTRRSDEMTIVWRHLEKHVIDSSVPRYPYDVVAVTNFLRVMVLRLSSPDSFISVLNMSRWHQQIMEEGARLRAWLPAYRVQRRGLTDEHCPLLAPLRALVHYYEEPTTTEDIWATVLHPL